VAVQQLLLCEEPLQNIPASPDTSNRVRIKNKDGTTTEKELRWQLDKKGIGNGTEQRQETRYNKDRQRDTIETR
jgi:hypothetical protein